MTSIDVDDQLRLIHHAAMRNVSRHHPDCARLEGCVCGLDAHNAKADETPRSDR